MTRSRLPQRRNAELFSFTHEGVSSKGSKLVDLSGRKYSRLTVIKLDSERTTKGSTFWICVCDCGAVRSVNAGKLNAGSTKSCGCLSRESASARRKSHGETGKTKEYIAWAAMKRRCLTPTDHAYHLYGGRGITVCVRWQERFETFLEDMGRAPSTEHSLDRIDCNGNYEPSNCRWATWTQQQNNRRNNVRFEYAGQLMTLTQIVSLARPPVCCETIRNRLKLGWSLNDALRLPVGGLPV